MRVSMACLCSTNNGRSSFISHHMKDYLLDWFTHQYAANKTLIQVIDTRASLPEKAASIFSHMLNAHQIWLHRIHPAGISLPLPWQPLEREQYAPINEQNFHLTKVYLQSEKFGMHFNKPVRYQNTQGETFENTIMEIYFHMLAHAAYHRGQIALLLRQAGEEPPISDYIFYKREPVRMMNP